jgi:leucyl aminopeptidase (aminopeptidase T)
MAKQIVNTSAGVKPGEQVIITGGKHTLPLMEAIAVEVARAGGEPEMLLNTDKVARATSVEMPESAIQASKSNSWVLGADVLITLPSLEDPKTVLEGITPERQAKFSKVAAESGINKKVDATKLRGVSVSYPNKSFATDRQLDYASYEQMIWAGIGTDYTAIATQAQQIKQLLATGKKVHITSPAGTDLTFQLAARPVFVDDGVVSGADQQEKMYLNRTAALPGGRIYSTNLETSATGRLVSAPGQWNGKPLRGFKADFKGGQMANAKAEVGNEDLQKWLALTDASLLQLGYLSIGLNPAMKTQKDYTPGTAAGMVLLGIGGNELQGGQNKGASNTIITFGIDNATVEIDGTVLVRNGQLVSPTTAKAAPGGKKTKSGSR